MVGYKLSKNDWVTPFFVIFRSVREKLLVTVFLDHPVIIGLGWVGWDLCVGLLYEHRFAVLIIVIIGLITNSKICFLLLSYIFTFFFIFVNYFCPL